MAIHQRRATLSRLSQAALILAVLAALWALVVALTGGFVLRAGALRISSHQARNPLAVALISGCAAWWLATREARQLELRPARSAGRRIGPADVSGRGPLTCRRASTR